MKQRLGEQTPILIENDANAAALGEAYIGGGKGFSDALCITLGTGVGGGVVVDRIRHHFLCYRVSRVCRFKNHPCAQFRM
ncbi:MAG: ROK family protein [Tumebacillaceae bacterium]